MSMESATVGLFEVFSHTLVAENIDMQFYKILSSMSLMYIPLNLGLTVQVIVEASSPLNVVVLVIDSYIEAATKSSIYVNEYIRCGRFYFVQ